MKRITFIIATCLLAAMSFSSCVVEESDRLDQSGTQKAYQMFMYWRYGYSNTQMRFANVAFNFNAWLSAPESARDSVALIYFKDYDIRDNGNGSWSILHQDKEIYTIETHNQLLSEPGVAWAVTEKKRVLNYIPGAARPEYNEVYNSGYNEFYNFSSSSVTAHISCLAQGQWKVKINDWEPGEYLDGGPVPHLSVTLSTPDQSVIHDLREGGYNISGHGCFEFARYAYPVDDDVSNVVALYFNVEDPLLCDGQDTWSDGNMNIVVYNGEPIGSPEYKTETTNVKYIVTAAPGSSTPSHYANIHYYEHEAMWSYGNNDGRFDVLWGNMLDNIFQD